MKQGFALKLFSLYFLLIFSTSVFAIVLNNPYPASEAQEKIYYSSFNEQPKTLDPARSYSSNEYQFIAQIYEPILQYDYFLRPYKLVCLLCDGMPLVENLNQAQNPVLSGESAAYTRYTIKLKKGVLYQPHPAFAKSKSGAYLYLDLPIDYLDDHDINTLSDFEVSGTREMNADDFIYQIKRLATPAVSSPIQGLMREHIVGFDSFFKQLPPKSVLNRYVDLRQYPLAGVKKLDDYTFQILIKEQYPQFLYWLSMPFFSPMPWEADKFYAQDDMHNHNLSLAWYPVGTGSFMLIENNPNSQMVLQKNPNYRAVYLSVPDGPTSSRRLPMIDKAIYVLEKESIPRWNKFLQGYYDSSTVGTDSFDQAVHVSHTGKLLLTPAMLDKHIRMRRYTDPSIFYLGFNMQDSLVGGNTERARLLRHAISIAVNYDEYITIFYNGRGHSAQSPIPPGIFGYREGKAGLNLEVYKMVGEKPVRRSIREAKSLMKLAGYPQGRDPKTGKALVLHYDAVSSGGPDDKSTFDWMRKQFAKIGIELNIRVTQYNQFQEKMRHGNIQIYSWGWNADYPDPENFLFLLYGPNGKKKFGGENSANYDNPEFNRLFVRMKLLANGLERQQVIDEMVRILRFDAPWSFGIHTESLVLTQSWMGKVNPNPFNSGTLQYLAVNVDLRNRQRAAWNQAVIWPFVVFVILVVLLMLPVFVTYLKKEKQKGLRIL